MAQAKPTFQIEIPRRNGRCCKGQEEFIPGTDYFSAIHENLEGNWERQDYCLHCWDGGVRQEVVKSARTTWKSKVPPKAVETSQARNRDERAFELLKSALADKEREDHSEAFVMALFLARRRLLVLRQEMRQEDGSVMNLYEDPITEEMLCVKKIALSQLQIDKIQVQLAQKMKVKTKNTEYVDG